MKCGVGPVLNSSKPSVAVEVAMIMERLFTVASLCD